jgi:hypothetical protein
MLAALCLPDVSSQELVVAFLNADCAAVVVRRADGLESSRVMGGCGTLLQFFYLHWLGGCCR